MLSPEGFEELQGDHTAIAKVEVWRSGKPVAILIPTSGSVPVEASAPVRRSLSCTLVDPTGELTVEEAEELLPEPPTGDLVGGNVGDLLNAYECEIAVFRGVRVPDPTGDRDEYVSLGVFRLTGRQISDGSGGVTISLTGQDRAIMYQVQMSRALPINAGTPVEVAIRMLLGMVNPGVALNAMRTNHTVGPLLFQPTINVWTEAQKLAESVGARLYHDRNGELVLAPIGTASDFPVAEYVEGGRLLLDVDVSEDSDTVNNVVVAESEDGSIRVTVEDDDPSSPTYSKGKFRKVFTLKNPYLNSIRQAIEAAVARLVYELGRSQKITVTVVCDPTRDVDEVILVHRPRSGLFRRSLVVAGINIPLAAKDSMSITCREARLSTSGQVLPDLAEDAR